MLGVCLGAVKHTTPVCLVWAIIRITVFACFLLMVIDLRRCHG